jgi:putative SbcD/Mre11-related phosphoesterase
MKMKEKEDHNKKYLMIGKCLYLKDPKILVIGDLHLGYEEMLHKQGVMIPIKQIQETIKELEMVFAKLAKEKLDVKKIVMLGDIKHNFGFDKGERFEVLEIFDFLRKYVSDKNIIVIKGNHDTIDIGRKFKDYYFSKGILFIHGDKEINKMRDVGIKMIIMGHEHPSVILREKKGVKSEKYKCFLKGKWKGKEVLVVPSFLDITIGRDLGGTNRHKSILGKGKNNFEVFVVSLDLDEEALSFGKLGKL